ncbi:MAG TPA: HNH endonuclease signature motif containing protein [Candidatus Polarisedimenticolia bacterium]|jgi:hypothetical protein|nr:HNH endonuclease signature motif containing protein [Candidatus Polarisedimenticolia bacterium]
MRRPLSSAALVLCLAFPGFLFGSSAGTAPHSGGSHAGKPATSSKQVHVDGYYKKDGTYVPPHDRAAPGTGSHTTTGAGAGTHGCKTCPRDEHGRIKRSEKAREDFMKKTGYPHGRPGYVVDHIVPLECGGADDPGNMQWQTAAEAKAKDKTERSCRQ